MPKSGLLIGPPGSGKTVALETLPCGTVDLSFDPGGWKSLERTPISMEERELINTGKKSGRQPKKLLFAKTLRQWLSIKENKLARDEILVIDYDPKVKSIQIGKSPFYDSSIFMESAADINELEKPIAQNRGICHVCMDSLTWLQWATLEAIVTFRGPTQSGYMGTDQDVYGKAIEKMKEIIDTGCHLPFDFILTAHIQSDKDDVTGKIKEEISIYGKKLPELIASMIDDIYYCQEDMSSGKPKYLWSAHSQGFLKAMRTRSFDNLPLTFEANFTKLYGDRLVHE
jgi:hypothetical protein